MGWQCHPAFLHQRLLGGFLVKIIEALELIELAFLFHQLIVCTDFDGNAVLHDDNAIRIPNGRKTVCDNKGGSPLDRGGDRLLYVIFRNVIKRACRFVKDQDLGVACNYTGDFSEYDDNHSYNERYAYNEKYDVSIRSFDVNKFLFFYTIRMEYVEGDVRETEFILEEAYITHFLEEAIIEENENNIDLASLIEGKEVVVGNTRYLGNEYDNGIFYRLDGKYEEMYVFYADDLLVIQVGSPDELPKFIAYR